MKNIIILLIASCLTLGCTSTSFPENQNLSDVAFARRATLTETISKVIKSKPSAIFDVYVEWGIMPGVYLADKENEYGTFYIGAGRSFFERSGINSAYRLRKGGFWLPKGKNDTPKIFYIFETENIVIKDLNATILTIGNVNNQKNPENANAAKNQLLGGAIGVGIVNSIIDAETESMKGKRFFIPDVENDSAIEKLKSINIDY